MTRTLAEALAWVEHGTALLTEQVATLDEREYSAPSILPGWTRKQLVAHVAANAEALGNLVHWARTGEPTPMYESPEQRDAGIEAGATYSTSRLSAWLRTSARELAKGFGALSDEQWAAEVRTRTGRAVPATEIPWMRAREVCVHAVDLGTGLTFADLPAPFLEALVAEILAKRDMDEAPEGALPEVTAYLAGRPHNLGDVPALGPWL